MTSKLHFARFHFEPIIPITTPEEEELKFVKDKEKLLKIISFETDINKYLHESKYKNLINKNISWDFGGINAEDDYIYGKLRKVKIKKTPLKDKDIKDFKLGTQEDGEVCNFLFDIKNHIFTFESKRNVGSKAPILIIESIYYSYYNNTKGSNNPNNPDKKEKIVFELLKNRKEITQRIDELKIITYVKLSLYPTNPNSSPTSQNMDEYLKSVGAEKADFEYFASEKGTGINLNAANGIVKSGIRLAEEGYGNARIKGYKEIEIQEEKGKSKRKIDVINSVGFPIEEEVELTTNNDLNKTVLIKTTSDLIKMYSDP